MPLLDRVKERTGSDLSDAELQAMIDAIAAELDARLGPVGPITVELGDPTDPCSRERRTLRLARPIDTGAAVTVVEVDPANSGDASAEVELDPADYGILHGGRTLARFIAGPNARAYWAPRVKVTYTPVSDQPLRDEATIKLVALDLSHRGLLRSERAGDYQFTLSNDPAADREAIFASLMPKSGMVMA